MKLLYDGGVFTSAWLHAQLPRRNCWCAPGMLLMNRRNVSTHHVPALSGPMSVLIRTHIRAMTGHCVQAEPGDGNRSSLQAAFEVAAHFAPSVLLLRGLPSLSAHAPGNPGMLLVPGMLCSWQIATCLITTRPACLGQCRLQQGLGVAGLVRMVMSHAPMVAGTVCSCLGLSRKQSCEPVLKAAVHVDNMLGACSDCMFLGLKHVGRQQGAVRSSRDSLPEGAAGCWRSGIRATQGRTQGRGSNG